MIIIGVDFHPEFQQIAWVDTESGEFQEQRLAHREDAEKFYRGLAAAGQKVRVGHDPARRRTPGAAQDREAEKHHSRIFIRARRTADQDLQEGVEVCL